MLRQTLCGLALALCLPAAANQRCDTDRQPLSTPTERYVDNGDGTVTDQVTQLMWMRCSDGQRWADGGCLGEASARDWVGAQAAAEQINASGDLFYTDWRLPSLTEIAAIVERACGEPRINLAVFPRTPPGIYWSSTPRPRDPRLVYALGFGDQGVATAPKDEPHHVRLVRNGP